MPEAAEAAEAASNDAGAGEGGAPEGGFDISPLNDRLDQMQEQFSSSLEDLSSRIQAPADEDQYGGDQPDLDSFPMFGDAGYDDDGIGYQEIDADQLEAGIDQIVQQRTAAIVGPLQDQIREMIDNQAAAQIEQRYPELQDQRVAEAAAEEAMRSGIAAEDLSPAHIALAHEAIKYRELQAQIEPTGQGGSDGMEAPGGTQPGSPSDTEFEQEIQNRITSHAERRLFN